MQYKKENLMHLDSIIVRCTREIKNASIYVTPWFVESNFDAENAALWSSTFLEADGEGTSYMFRTSFEVKLHHSDCELCPLQLYSDEEGMTSCLGCPPGKTASVFELGIDSLTNLQCKVSYAPSSFLYLPAPQRTKLTQSSQNHF